MRRIFDQNNSSMKKSVFLFISLLLCTFVFGQKKWAPFSNMPEMGYAFELAVQQANVGEVSSALMGLRGGINFNNHYATGVSFKWSLNQIAPPAEMDKDVFLNIAFSSAYFEYTFSPDKRIHITIPIDVGAGDVNMEPYGGGQNATLFPYGESYFFYTEPGLLTELNISRKIRLNLGMTYIWVPKLEYRAVNAQNVSGFCPKIGIKYGRFY